MRECKFKKRVQIYLDGWMDGKERARFEAHLKQCSYCQTEMIDLEEISSAALEIVDQAPDIDYWKNFSIRVLNRIISRDVSPYGEKQRSTRSRRLKIGSYSVAITTLAAAVLLILNYTGRSIDIPNSGIRDGVEISWPTAATDIVEPVIFTAEESEEPPVVEESGNILAGQKSVPAEGKALATVEQSSSTVNEIEENISRFSGAVLAFQSDYDLRAVVRKPAPLKLAPLKLDNDYNFLNRLMAAYRGRVANDYRISQAVVAEGILSGYTSRDVNGFDNGNFGLLYVGPFHGLTGDGYSSGWGYLSLPDDTSNAEELRKYLIELELMQVK
ncbi:MAG: zf-HC2 domain-containing protein [candidate division Zixibacteria bacterium]